MPRESDNPVNPTGSDQHRHTPCGDGYMRAPFSTLAYGGPGLGRGRVPRECCHPADPTGSVQHWHVNPVATGKRDGFGIAGIGMADDAHTGIGG